MKSINSKALTKQFTIMITVVLLNLVLVPVLSLFCIQVVVADSTPRCISYNSTKKLIKITCKSANLTDIDNQLNNDDILENQLDTTDHNDNDGVEYGC